MVFSMSDVKVFIIVSHPRSGSTFLANNLRQFEEFNCVMEPFHQHPAVVTQHIIGGFGDSGRNYLRMLEDENLDLHLYSHEHVLRYLEDLKGLCSKPYLVLKLFPGHLPFNALQLLLKTVDGVIFLNRNVVHSYISNQIAKENNVYGGKDTSNEQPEFSTSGFVWWNNYLSDFMLKVEDFVFKSQIANIRLSYESLLQANNATDFLKSRMNAFGLELNIVANTKTNKRQDNRTLASDKVLNPEFMMDYLRSIGLDYLNDVRASADILLKLD
jgi:hypothetical protein